MIIFIILFLLFAVISIVLLVKYNKEKANYDQERKTHYQNIREEIKQKEKSAIEEEIRRETNDLTKRLTDIKFDIVNRTNERSNIETQIKEKQDFNKSLSNTSDDLRRLIEKQRQEQQASILSELRLFREKEETKLSTELDNERKKIYSSLEEERKKIDNEIIEWAKSAQEVANETSSEIFNEIEQTSAELETIRLELEEFRKKRESINEAIRKEQELENGIDSRRIVLSEEDKQDIHYLVSIENRINNKEVLHKLIWSEYIQKPFKQMLNRIFGSKNPKCVIYCIENIDTHQKYIGKTKAEVSKRWQEHIKSSLGIGTISHQHIHDVMFGNWDKFSFSIIEEAEEANINEREKYYIAMFESDKYGYNMKAGG